MTPEERASKVFEEETWDTEAEGVEVFAKAIREAEEERVKQLADYFDALAQWTRIRGLPSNGIAPGNVARTIREGAWRKTS